MRVTVCGELRIEGDASTLVQRELPGRLGRRLWAYLVLNRRRAMASGELATALWSDTIPDAWEASLHALISRVRREVDRIGAGATIRALGAGYALDLPPGTFVDRERAWTAIDHVRAMLRRGEIAPAWAEAVIAHEIAARGFLPGESGEWVEAERRLLRGIELQALEVVGEADWRGADPLRRSERRGRSSASIRCASPGTASSCAVWPPAATRPRLRV